jgi:hypothetical protein
MPADRLPYKARESRRKADIKRNGRRRDEDDLQPVIEIDPLMRPPRSDNDFIPNQSQRVMVAALAACNVGYDGIAAYIKVNETTLRKFFRYELVEGHDRTEAALVGVLVAKALSGNITAINTMLKCVFGWSETGKKADGNATIETLSTEQRAALIEALRTSIDTPKARSGARRNNQTNLVTIPGTAD